MKTSWLPKGFVDFDIEQIKFISYICPIIERICKLHAFIPLQTPAIEYAQNLGQFLPDKDRPNQGIFAILDNDKQWLALRYDLTAPLARYVSQNFNNITKPFKRYQIGSVWRNEKPDKGRFREFIQFDIDIVGSKETYAEAQLCILIMEILENIKISDYKIKVSNRKLLDGCLQEIGITDEKQKLIILRAIDKLDRLGQNAVVELLGKGRQDKSGDFTKGANLNNKEIDTIIQFINTGNGANLNNIPVSFNNKTTMEGIDEIHKISTLLPDNTKVIFSPSTVRGLDYYTGPVFEIELTKYNAGAIGGGGRYDTLTKRFQLQSIPATGISLGISRLYTILKDTWDTNNNTGPVIILNIKNEDINSYHLMAKELRNNNICAEVYPDTVSLKKQLKYADKRKAPVVIIEGEDEKICNKVTVKNMFLGKKLSEKITSNQQWRNEQPAQIKIDKIRLTEYIRTVLKNNQC